MLKQIFIINGSGGSGKDEFVNMVSNNRYKLLFSSSNGSDAYVQILEVGNYSSVDKVKQIAKFIGWNGEKTERDRKFLSDLKLLTTEYNDMPLNDMKGFANRFFSNNNKYDKILFLHIREPKEIAKAVKEFNKCGYDVKTVLVKRKSIKHIVSNMADKNVYNYRYDVTINNDGSLDDLKQKAKCFVDDFHNNCLKEKY